MINLDSINTLKSYFNKSYNSLHSQILGNSYSESEVLYNENNCKKFVADFESIVINSLPDRIALKAYIEDIYYNRIVWFYISFQGLGKFYNESSNNLFSSEDLIANSISANWQMLKGIADIIYSRAKRHGFDIKHYLQITLEEYNISGEYIPLFKYNKDLQNNQNENKEISKPKRVSQKKTEIKSKTLLDIWHKDKTEIYSKCIEILRDDNAITFQPFITVRDDKMYWMNKKGGQTYLACFVFICIQKKWIDDIELTSAPIITAICKNTFNFEGNLDNEVFRKISTSALPDKKLNQMTEILQRL